MLTLAIPLSLLVVVLVWLGWVVRARPRQPALTLRNWRPWLLAGALVLAVLVQIPPFERLRRSRSARTCCSTSC